MMHIRYHRCFSATQSGPQCCDNPFLGVSSYIDIARIPLAGGMPGSWSYGPIKKQSHLAHGKHAEVGHDGQGAAPAERGEESDDDDSSVDDSSGESDSEEDDENLTALVSFCVLCIGYCHLPQRPA